MSERCFYKVQNKESDLFKKASEFLHNENELRNIQDEVVKEKLPRFSYYKSMSGFTRIIQYVGFVFDDQQSIDPKVWKTKEVEGKMLSTPNLRTKAGKEMAEFLRSFKRTTCWDVDRLLNIDKHSFMGSFYPASLFKYNNCVYIIIDSQCRELFESNNTDIMEITYGEMEEAIDCYKKEIGNSAAKQ